jgi:hypothetical protein
MRSFQDYLTEHIGSSCARQLALANFLGEGDWGVDIEEGVFTYTPDKSFPLQLLGTESHNDNTWLWAWANTQSNIPTKLLRTVNEIRGHGETDGLMLFTTRSFRLDNVSGHGISMVCSGLAGGKCYYRGPYDGGALFFLLEDVPASVLTPVPAERAITVINEVISQFELNHRRMVESFLVQQGYVLRNNEESLEATAQSGSVLSLTFDDRGLLLKTEARLEPNSAKPIKKAWQFWK